MKVEDLKNTKIYLKTEDESVQFQRKVFNLGVEWIEGGNVIDSSCNFFHISQQLKLYCCYYTTSLHFIDIRKKQIFLEDVLAIEESKKECKFKPYDKVLVRDYDNERWRPRLFAWHNVDYKEDCSYPFETTDSDFYRYCIPYDENLANTTKSKDE